MIEREKVIKELDEHIESALTVDSDYVDCVRTDLLQCTVALLKEQDAEIENLKQTAQSMMEGICLLKEQKDLKQKMWNALYAEEDNLEKKFIGTEEHDDWFTVYRPWLQRGFEIAIKVIAEQDGM